MENSGSDSSSDLRSTAVGIAQIGLDGTWLRVNNQYCQMLGYSECQLRTKTLKDITHPDDYDEILDMRRQLEGTISSHSTEKRCIHSDGTIFLGKAQWIAGT